MIVTDLVNLAKKSVKIFNEHVIKENLEPPMRAYIREFPTKFELTESGHSCGFSGEIVHKPDWSMIIFNFIDKIKKKPAFAQLAQSIAARYKKNIQDLAEGCNELAQVTFWLERFIQKIIYNNLDKELSENQIIEYAVLFNSDLELNPSEYNYTFYLNGIFLECESVKINDNVIIRKPQKEDFEYTRDIFFDIPRHHHIRIPSSILEMNMIAKDNKECRAYANRILNALRLYKLGSIYPINQIETRKSIIWGGSQISWNGNYTSIKNYTVNETELKDFIDIVIEIEQKLNFNKKEKKNWGLLISLERYNSALLESLDIDRKVMTTIMGLESLFSLEKDRGENAYKLGVRVAKLLGFMRPDIEEVRTLIESGYKFRNDVVHGMYIKQNQREKMEKNLLKLLDYLRMSLIFFLINQQQGKNKLVDIIDKSLISDNYGEQLKRLFQNGIIICPNM
ncbi:HEPN domain-containing protein [Candidatus Borrarchaeum sp.]|uniref:HEPN domain-containing protein n=1 Tax=Candidatus Borrarchaeum sp. TaxID=2846742 RepID=UPI00257C4278|nr:HEPN domain-containing protein [Candidatus Borrarchaeum sp.]